MSTSEDLNGYYKTPVTLASIYVIASCSFYDLATTGPSESGLFSFDRTKIIHGYQFWRLLTCHFAFRKVTSTVFGLLTLHQFRFIERLMGSTKYGTFVFLMSMFSSVAQFVVPHGLQPSGSKNGGGPFALIGALAWIYYQRIPSLKMLDNARFSFLNHSKSPTYMFLATFLWNEWKVQTSNIWYSLFGVGCSMICLNSSTSCSLLNWCPCPAFVVSIAQLFAPLVRVIPPSVQRQRLQQQHVAARQRMMATQEGLEPRENNNNPGQGFRDQLLPGFAGRGRFDRSSQRQPRATAVARRTPEAEARASAPTAALSEESIQSLINLGFERDQIIPALVAANHNVQTAANRLLNVDS